MKKNTPYTNQQPKDPQGQRFIAWFPHRWNFIEASDFDTNHHGHLTVPRATRHPCPPQLSRQTRRSAWRGARKAAKSGEKNKPNWRTVKEYRIEPVVLWYRWKDPTDLVGVSFDSETRYAVADVDRDSPIHPYNDERAFREWLSSFEDIGLVGYVILRSSFSEGLHIYFPLPKLTGTFNLACALQICAEKAGVKVKSGELEFFPNTKNYCKHKPTAYKAHRMPLQPHTGSVVLDDDLNPIGDSTELFCDQMEWAAAKQDMDALEVACSVGRQIINFRRFGYRNQTLLAKFKRDLEIIIAEGWTKKGITNFILGKIAAYGMIFTEHEGAELADYILQTAKACDGYREYCNHHHDIERRARDYARSAERYYWKPGTPRKRVGTYQENFCNPTNPNHNQEVAETAQGRIIGGVNSLLQAGINLTVTGIVAFRDALIAEIEKLHGVIVSNSTLTKYRNLWHPKKKGIVLGTKESVRETPVAEPKPEPAIAEVETNYVEPKSDEPISSDEVQKNTEFKSSKSRQKKRCTHQVPKSLKYKTPKASQDKGCTHLSLYEGLKGINLQLGDLVRYVGKGSSGLIELKERLFSQIATIEPNEIVKLVSTYHSSDLREDPTLRKIVYVRPIERAKSQQWKEKAAIAVFLDELERLEIQPEPNQKQDNQRSPDNFSSNSNPTNPKIQQAKQQSIRITYSPKSAASPKTDNKHSLSDEYYSELVERHSDWQKFELERRSPSYQQQARAAFAKAREVLERKRK